MGVGANLADFDRFPRSRIEPRRAVTPVDVHAENGARTFAPHIEIDHVGLVSDGRCGIERLIRLKEIPVVKVRLQVLPVKTFKESAHNALLPRGFEFDRLVPTYRLVFRRNRFQAVV